MNTPEPPPYPTAPPVPQYSPQQGGYPPQEPQNNGLALASLITGIVGTTGCCCCPFLVSSLAAIICGHMGLSRSRIIGKGRGMALAGLIMGYLSFVGFATVMVVQFTSPEFKETIEKTKAEFEKIMQQAQDEAQKQQQQQQQQQSPPQ